jgi:hypothetical protein
MKKSTVMIQHIQRTKPERHHGDKEHDRWMFGVYCGE